MLLLLAACKTSHAIDVQEAVKLSDVEHAEASGERHEGAWTETEYDFAPGTTLAEGRGALGTAYPPSAAVRQQHLPDSNRATVENAPLLPETAAIVKVTVRQHGPITEAWRSSSGGLLGAETTMTLKADDKSEPDAGCAFSGGLWLALVGCGLAGLIWFRRAALLAVCKGGQRGAGGCRHHEHLVRRDAGHLAVGDGRQPHDGGGAALAAALGRRGVLQHHEHRRAASGGARRRRASSRRTSRARRRSRAPWRCPTPSPSTRR
jgi:hypothetical protein